MITQSNFMVQLSFTTVLTHTCSHIGKQIIVDCGVQCHAYGNFDMCWEEDGIKLTSSWLPENYFFHPYCWAAVCMMYMAGRCWASTCIFFSGILSSLFQEEEGFIKSFMYITKEKLSVNQGLNYIKTYLAIISSIKNHKRITSCPDLNKWETK